MGGFWRGCRGRFGNVLLRREQYRWADREDTTRSGRESGGDGEARQLPDGVAAGVAGEAGRRGLRRIGTAQPAGWDFAGYGSLRTEKLEEIRGHEGDAARTYFSVFDHLIVATEGGVLFSRAQPRGRRWIT